jgi:hypothetical protein
VNRPPAQRSAITVRVPDAWETQERPRPEIEYFALPRVDVEVRRRGLFVPNIVGVLNPFAGGLHEFSARAQAQFLATFDSGRILDVSTVGGPGGEGRVLLTSRSQDGRTLLGIEYLTLRRGWAVQQTATMTTPQYPSLKPVFDAIAASSDVVEDAPSAAPDQLDDYDIATDDLATGAAGAPRERLDSVRNVAHYRSEGPVLSPAALTLLMEMSRGSRPGRLGGQGSALQELQSAGLVDGHRPAPDAKPVLEVLSAPLAQLKVTGHHGQVASDVQVAFRGDWAVMVSGPSVHFLHHEETLGIASSGFRQLDLVRTEQLAVDLFSWAGAGPAWTLPLEQPAVPRSAVEAHWHETTAPPAEGPVLAEVWERPWFVWTVEGTAASGTVADRAVRISVGDRGTYRLGDRGHEVQLVPETPEQIFRHLVGTVADLLES